MSIEEDKKFLLKQREKGRSGCMIGVDARLAQVEERRSQKMAAEMKRRIETLHFDYDEDSEDLFGTSSLSSETDSQESTDWQETQDITMASTSADREPERKKVEVSKNLFLMIP